MTPVIPKVNQFKVIEEYIQRQDLINAINELFLLIKNIDLNSSIQEIYRYLFQLLPAINTQFVTLMNHLPRLLSASSNFFEEQRELAFRLGQRSFENTEQFKSPSFLAFHEAMDYFGKALQIEEKFNTPFSENIHQSASILILQAYLSTGTFKNRLEWAVGRSKVEEFDALLRQIEKFTYFCSKQEDLLIIKEFYNQARDVWVNIRPNQEHFYAGYGKLISEKRDQLFPLSSDYPTQNYRNLLKDIREEFKSSPKLDKIRNFQASLFHKFERFFQTFLTDAMILLGPPPCPYDFLAMGSIGREEICPFSDLELLLLIDNVEHQSYFLTLMQILELQIRSLGETASAHLTFTCLHQKNRSGFHLDTGGNPARVLDLLNTPEAVASLQKKDKNVDPNSIAHTTLKCKSLSSSSPELYERYQKALFISFDAPIKALQYCKVRFNYYKETWRKPHLAEVINLKSDFVWLLNYLLADLSLYFGIEKANTIDIVDEMVSKDIFSIRSGNLLKEAVSFIYKLRIRLHEFYHEQKEEVYLSGLEGYVLTSQEKSNLEKTYWLVLRPLYTLLSFVFEKGKNCREIFQRVDLLQVAYDEIFNCEDPDYLNPLMCYLVAYLIETKSDHISFFTKLSNNSKTEGLRRLYFELLEKFNAEEEITLLATIPNRSGFRFLFSIKAKNLRNQLRTLTSSTAQKIENYPIKEVKITGFSEGAYLKAEFIKTLLDEEGNIKKAYGSFHLVSFAGSLHFKQKPTHPLMEYAIHNLLFRLSGNLTPPTQLVRFEVDLGKEKKIYPVLVSETIPGITLKEVVKQKFELNETAWSRWTWVLLASILTRPGDGLLSNYIVDKDQNIFCIDNDISFIEPVVKEIVSRKVNFCCALFCLFPERSLNTEVLKEFCRLDPDALLNDWIEDVIRKEKEYLNLFTEQEREKLYHEDPKNRFKATILFKEGTLATLNLQFVRLQNHLLTLLQQNKTLTSLDLLKQLLSLRENSNVENTIGLFVLQAYKKSLSLSSIDERLKQITSRNHEMSLTSLQSDVACLGKIPSLQEIEKKELFTPAKAREELFLTLLKRSTDYISTGSIQGKRTFKISFQQMTQEKVPDRDRQILVLRAVIHLLDLETKKPISVTLQHCAVLDSETLIPFLHEKLEYLDISFCPQIRDRDIETIQQKCPFLHTLHLSGLSQLKNISTGLFTSLPLDFSKYELLKLVGHTESVEALIPLEEGKKIASRSADNTIRIWDIKTKDLKIFSSNTRLVGTLAALNGGKKIAYGSYDNSIRILDLEIGKEFKKLTGHTNLVRTLIPIEGDKKIASGSMDTTIRIWDVKTGNELQILMGHTKSVSTLISIEGDKKIASGSMDTTIRIWNRETGNELKILTGHREAVQTLISLKGGKKIASGSMDTTIRIWNPETGNELKILTGHTGPIETLIPLEEDKKIASGAWDKTIRIWEVETGNELKKLTGHTDSVTTLIPLKGGKKIASGSWDKTIRIWSIKPGLEHLYLEWCENLQSIKIKAALKTFSTSNNSRLRSIDIQTTFFPKLEFKKCEQLNLQLTVKSILDQLLTSEEKDKFPILLPIDVLMIGASIVRQDPSWQKKLSSLIEASKTNSQLTITAANAIALLNIGPLA